MALYEIKIGGRTVQVEAAETATDQEIVALARQEAASTQDRTMETVSRAGDAGLMANFDDEIFSGLKSVNPLGKTGTTVFDGKTSLSGAYGRNVKQYRARSENLERDNPKSWATGEVAGSLIGGVGLAKAGAGLARRFAPEALAKIAALASGRPRTAALVAGAGGGGGGAAVAGAGEGQDFDSRMKAAIQGGTIGTLMGGAIGVGVGAVGPFLKRYIDAVRNKNGEKEAARQLSVALRADGYDVSTPEGVNKALSYLEKTFALKRQATLADIGNTTRTRTATATRFPSSQQDAAREQIAGRARGQSARLAEDVKNTVAPLDSPIGDRPGGTRRLDVTKMSDELIESRKAMAKTDREKAFWENVQAEKSRLRLRLAVDYNDGERQPGNMFRLAYLKDAYGDETPSNVSFFATGYPKHENLTDVPNLFNVDVYNSEGGLSNMEAAGPSTVLNALRDLRRDAPDVGGLTGYRVSGARDKARTDLRNRLRRANNPNEPERDEYYIPENDLYIPESDEPILTGAVLPPGVTRNTSKSRLTDSGDPLIDMRKVKPSPPLDPGGRRPRMINDKRVEELMKDPQGNGAMALREAMRLEKADRARRAAMGEDISGLPELRAEGPYTYEMIDKAKQYLDGSITRLERGTTDNAFTAADMHNVIRFRNDLRGIMKDTNPEYKAYLDNYGDNSAMIKGLEEGPAYRSLSPEQIAKEQGERSQGAREMYRVGAARDNVNRLEKNSDKPGGAASSIAESDVERSRLKALGMTDDEIAELTGARTEEMQLDKLFTETKNGGIPAMARREAEDQATGLPSINVPYNLASPVGWSGAMARKASDRLMLRGTTSVNESLLPMALSSGADVAKVLEALRRAGLDELKAGNRRASNAGKYSYTIGVPIGGAVAVNPEEEY